MLIGAQLRLAGLEERAECPTQTRALEAGRGTRPDVGVLRPLAAFRNRETTTSPVRAGSRPRSEGAWRREIGERLKRDRSAAVGFKDRFAHLLEFVVVCLDRDEDLPGFHFLLQGPQVLLGLI